MSRSRHLSEVYNTILEARGKEEEKLIIILQASKIKRIKKYFCNMTRKSTNDQLFTYFIYNAISLS